MDDTANKAETAPNEALNNNGSPAEATPNQEANAVNAELLRKEAEQAKMRANQLANELDAIKKSQEEAKQKQLEEQQEYKTLYEQSQEQLREAAEAKERNEKAQKIAEQQAQLVTQYSDAVIKVAETTGLSLTDTDEESVKAYKAKMDTLQEQVGKGAKVTSNNNNPVKVDTEDRGAFIEQAKQGNKQAMDQAIGTLGFVKAWKSQDQQTETIPKQTLKN